MSINRNNYETIFLLYVDGELSAEQRKTVELFVQENPDLQAELDILMQTKLPVDEIHFNNKEALLKNNYSSIQADNYEEQFLLYVDNELSLNERNEVEKFVLQHPELQEVFTVLKQTHLEKEEIIFADKSVLYRKERKPVIYLNWQRLAIAAVFMGLSILLWNIVPSENIKTVAENRQQNNETIEIKKLNPGKGNVLPATTIHNQQVIAIRQSYNKQEKKERNVINDHNTVAQNIISTNNDQSNKDVAVNTIRIPSDKIINVKPVSNSSNNTTPVSDNVEHSNIIQPTVYKELDIDEDDKNNIYIGNMEINKNKLRGLIKKAGHLFNRPKDEDAKTSIAGFPITKSSE
jgi:hypothetical protein